ncbi:putative nuclease HARBI1 [Astyanax mexicanus]|uniref:putative nuclease HARBI1 n=1 Tax=Astyanax mexicanus TaxID=7994 RepID=UPI0020CACDB7|nr:putative nuclease HARBI1 [Astyanax mexicanus]
MRCSETYLAALRQETDHGWSRDIEVLVFLYWLAHAASYRVVSRAFAIPRSSVHDIVHRVSKDVSEIIKRVITLPTGDDLEVIGAGFAHLAGSPAFTVAVGAIDGCHIRIKPPSANAQCYLNRKLFHSVQLQAICDHQGKCILGDGGYPCISTPIKLLTPYREPVQNPVQARFNRKLSRARCVIERAFGMLKTRWRSIFFKALEVSPVFAPEVVACCAVLHNLCIAHGDIIEPDVPEEEDAHAPEPAQTEERSGNEARENLAAAVSAPQMAVPALLEHDYL